MDRPGVRLLFAADLRFFLPHPHRGGEVRAVHDPTATLGHLVQSLGVPLTEVGRLAVDGRAVPDSHRPAPGGTVEVAGVARPQPLPFAPRFLLDVHLGALARRLRLVGVDTAYGNDLDDDTLVATANTDRRALLTQDRRLLHRRDLTAGAYVRGHGPDDQFRDVLDRFAPPLAPWTRCPACNGTVSPAAKESVAHLLEPGTRRTYDTFTRCDTCGRVYWPGAHHHRLTEVVRTAESVVAASDR
ncbi:Mut7-C ubiquitin/RNAse domain-containing protein [Streptomonospora sp. S1-112]|uniref:Mut7-C ubiquitin/RNAse domain-containing protein n=1 Tax=Streptomonospora mangrovi TaxID=2883123 RepID=A0A9X3SDU6_9ACTN|nr:Mut7-C RNAse domain-containing protein [Streptomonospora mangrovi]MDA0565258.1 Mut7-C ubiquitin/RNAse domain-containing protein [Streptomonospora mangrovi]